MREGVRYRRRDAVGQEAEVVELPRSVLRRQLAKVRRVRDEEKRALSPTVPRNISPSFHTQDRIKHALYSQCVDVGSLHGLRNNASRGRTGCA